MTALALPTGWSLPSVRYGLDGPLCFCALALLACGLVMVASASVAVAERATGSPLYFFYKQLTFSIIGVVAGTIAFSISMKTWSASGIWLLAFALFLLLVVLIPGVGTTVNHAQRWIDLGPVRLQASEPARLALVIFLASHVVRNQVALQNDLRALMRPLIPIGLASILLLVEPDFGAMALLIVISGLILFLAGARLFHLFLLAAGAAVALTVLVVSAPYRLRRLMSFTDPWGDIENSGWQLAQSLIAIGRGEWAGVGLGNSVQKLLYLPETHTDFIFAIWAEETGLAGIVVMLGLFSLLVWRSFVVGREAERRQDRFAGYLCYALGGWIGLQTLVNMAVNMGLVPTKGLTLPLISYGGSSLVTTCVMLALVLRADYENRLARARAPAGGFRSMGVGL